LLSYKDGYYTNGIFLRLNKASEHNGQKRLYHYELGQIIFTPGDRRWVNRGIIDRPFCSYLYAQFGMSYFSRNASLVKWLANVGITGKAALGEQVQNGYHTLMGYSKYPKWDKQIGEAVYANASLLWSPTIMHQKEKNYFDIQPALQATLGTTFTNAKAGIYILAGLFENKDNSALWGGSVQYRKPVLKRDYELFVYCYPQLTLQGYNATIQGPLYNKSTTAITADPARFFFQQAFGFIFSRHRFLFRTEYVYETKETPIQLQNHRYISLQFGYRFK